MVTSSDSRQSIHYHFIHAIEEGKHQGVDVEEVEDEDPDEESVRRIVELGESRTWLTSTSSQSPGDRLRRRRRC